MKLSIGILIIITISISAYSQGQRQKQAVEAIDQIFSDYIKQTGGSESDENRMQMEVAFESLQANCDTHYFSKLIDVWMYYDPTDFPTRRLVSSILYTNKKEALKAIEKRIAQRKESERDDIAPFSDLLSLRKEFAGK